MKGFLLDQNGDLLLYNNELQMAYGDDLTDQTVRMVLGTNKKDWFLNWDEGIQFQNILGKHITDDMLKTEVLAGLKQVDDTFALDSFTVTREARTATVQFTAHNSDGAVVEEVYTWA